MNVNNIINGLAGKAAAASSTEGANAGGKSAGEVGSDAFMKLLVEQLKHQDPMQPQDGTQFVTQLAQFNSLNQLIGIKGALDQLIAQTGVKQG